MVGETILLTPGRVTAGTMVKVTPLRAHNAGIALGQLGKTGVTVALTKALFRATTAMNAVDITYMLYSYALTYGVIQRNSLVVQW
jgi:hypothetical protein